MLSLILIVISGYLVGSIPTSIIAGKLLRGIDIRKHGSGNAGATNVFRVLGPKPGIAVMLIDIGKGVLATLVISSIRVDPVPLSAALVQIIAGLSAVSGHIWTIFARFRGGKGVGTAAGMVFSLFPIAALICLGVFVVIVISTRYVSIASMSSAVALPLSLIVLKETQVKVVPDVLMIFSLIVAALIIFTHRSNIKRLINGTENRFSKPSFGKKRNG